MRKGLGALFVALVVAGCSTLGWSDATSGATKVLFDSYELDMTWGYSLTGIFVDSDGGVWRYRRDEPWYPVEIRSTVARESDLLMKYQGAERVASVDGAVLEVMIDRVPGAARGAVVGEPISFERSGSLDVAYTYDAREGRYDQIFLGGRGDWAIRNDSREAKELVDWLREVRKSAGME